MFSGPLQAAALSSDLASSHLPADQVFLAFSHSFLSGLILLVLTLLFQRAIDPRLMRGADMAPDSGPDNKVLAQLLIGATNQIFLTLGLTAILLLVNHNLVRAIGVYAAIALMRFRVNLNGKSFNAPLIFSVTAGIGCGLREFSFVWALVGFYAILSILVRLAFKWLPKSITTPKPATVTALHTSPTHGQSHAPSKDKAVQV